MPQAWLTDRTALVTGAGAGIGRAIALRLAAEGATVLSADIDPAAAARTAQLVQQAGGTAQSFEVDIASTDSITALAATVRERHLKLDGLVNNAGVNGGLPLLEVTPEEWDRVNDVNARGTFFCLQAFARWMRETGGGRIVNISSIAAKGFRRSASAPYAASKAAVIAITRFAALQLAADGINVNAVCPGPTRSDLFASIVRKHADEQGQSLEAAYGVFDEFIPLRRSNEPADVAATVAFLLSDDARNITGQSYNVDGGLIFD